MMNRETFLRKSCLIVFGITVLFLLGTFVQTKIIAINMFREAFVIFIILFSLTSFCIVVYLFKMRKKYLNLSKKKYFLGLFIINFTVVLLFSCVFFITSLVNLGSFGTVSNSLFSSIISSLMFGFISIVGPVAGLTIKGSFDAYSFIFLFNIILYLLTILLQKMKYPNAVKFLIWFINMVCWILGGVITFLIPKIISAI